MQNSADKRACAVTIYIICVHNIGTCNEFTRYPDSITLAGAQLRPVGDGYTIEHCMQSCLDERSFTCAAILIQQPSTCYLTGYSLRNDFFSQHYMRVCNHGMLETLITSHEYCCGDSTQCPLHMHTCRYFNKHTPYICFVLLHIKEENISHTECLLCTKN